jgi:hypothetical protein
MNASTLLTSLYAPSEGELKYHLMWLFAYRLAHDPYFRLWMAIWPGDW